MSSKTSIFKNISDDEVNNFLGSLPYRKYKKNHILIFEDFPADYIYIVKEGHLKIYRTFQDKEIILGFVEKNDIIGEIELFSHSHALSSVEVIQDAELYFMSKTEFIHFIKSNDNALENIFSIYNERFKQLNGQIRALTFHNVHTRVCHILLTLIDYDQEKPYIIENMNQTLIANMIGATRESVSKTFKLLQDEEIVHYEQRKITIINYDLLSYYGNLEQWFSLLIKILSQQALTPNELFYIEYVKQNTLIVYALSFYPFLLLVII